VIANSIYPLLVLTQSIPKVALAPILVVIFGSNELPRVVVTFLVAFFPLVLSIAAGIASVPPELIELGRACKASRWRELWRIRLPYAVPFVFSGVKAAITLSVVGAVVGEFVNADKGLGYLIVTSTAFFQVPLAWGALVLLSLLGIVLFQAVVIIERIFFPWAVDADKQAV
jgi:NitT/TauT family transport system permease protein